MEIGRKNISGNINIVTSAAGYARNTVHREMSEREGMYGNLIAKLGIRHAPGIQKSGLLPYGNGSGEPHNHQ